MTRTSFYSRAALTTALLYSLSVLTACSDPSANAGEGAAAGGMPPASVNVLTVQPQSVPLLIETPALLAGSREVEIRARVSGIVEKRNFNEGAKVEAEQSLFSLDAATFEATVNRNKAELAAAQARQAQAERTLKRLDKLRKDGAVSQQSLDDALSAVDVAKADVKTAEAILQQAQVQLNYTEVRSPISGIRARGVADLCYPAGPDVCAFFCGRARSAAAEG